MGREQWRWSTGAAWPYLYCSKCVGGRVTSECVASGETTLRLVRRDALEREASALLELILVNYACAVDAVVRAALRAADDHEQKRTHRSIRQTPLPSGTFGY